MYQRTGQPCRRCGRPIRRIVIGIRATHFCSWCQRLPAAERPAAKPLLATMTPRPGRGASGRAGRRWVDLDGDGALGRTSDEATTGPRAGGADAPRRPRRDGPPRGRQPVVTVVWPGLVIEMTPPQVQLHVESEVSAALPPIVTVADPGDQGELVAGMHGAGVGVPSAAEVAAATAGFDCVVHIPNVARLVIGAWSITVARSAPPPCIS